ncbi:spore germination protein KA [Ruminiclostridium sufflavum DSM 19573]|uniref:Spore germination protein KA n=1 Tax=Ruminiclostridium sufflavum DSM 19573 TaxID=1121337 RepID=A0A318Y5Y2_9FIRM|nr:spore germination protein [Ruminiclostridium sufflavum]PYG87400.1 spore germination protein KA [Ruminiclostridium sufflavum DSM 19573]
MKKDSIFSRALSLITYKNAEKAKTFTIPEVEQSKNNAAGTAQYDNNGQTSKKSVHKNTRIIKKPIAPSEQKNNKSAIKADENHISNNIASNMAYLNNKFNYPDNKDFIIREFIIKGKYKAFLVYIDGMVDRMTINNFILRPLLKDENFVNENEVCELDYILANVIETNQAVKVTKPDEVIEEILIGDTGLYVDGCDYYIFSETKGYDKRNVDKPLIEGVVKGSQEAFNENLKTNTTLIRKIIKNNDLMTEFLKIGEKNNNLCAIMYVKGIVNPAIVEEVKRRISSLKTDYISGSGMLEQFIEENSWSIVPTILSTERPDRTASHILDGKVAIIAEGTPFALIVPITLFSLFHSPEDTSMRWQYGTLMRFIRIGAFFFATLLPGLYVALTNFHREMIPTDLLIAIAKAQENIPFPTILQVIFMEFAFELIREAGIRIPGIIGNTIGIIGALILGQAAVQANLVSPVLIIIIAITGLGNFAIPDFSLAFGARIIRLFFITMGCFIGFYGISLGLVVITALIANTKSFGVNMLEPLAPWIKKSQDLIIRKPVWKQERRPDYLNAVDKTMQPLISRKWTITDAQNPIQDKISSKRRDKDEQ